MSGVEGAGRKARTYAGRDSCGRRWTGNVSAEAESRFPAPASLSRRFSREGVDPFDDVEWEIRRSVITNPDGSVVFRMDDVDVPKDGRSSRRTSWPPIPAQAGVPGTGRERSVRELVTRVVKTIRAAVKISAGTSTIATRPTLRGGAVGVAGDPARAFNSRVVQLRSLHAYRIDGSGGTGVDPRRTATGDDRRLQPPQCSACFIQSVEDDLMSIFQLVKNEARLFKYGSAPGRTSPRCAAAPRTSRAAARARAS